MHRMTDGDECHSGTSCRRQAFTTQNTKVDSTVGYDKCLSSRDECVENSSTIAVSVPINLSIKLGFVYVNGPRETYFVDVLCRAY